LPNDNELILNTFVTSKNGA